MKKLPKFLSKLRESEKVETMGRTARRRQGVFFGRLGVPERSGAGAAGSGRCAVVVFFGEGAAGRWAGPAGGTMRRRVPTQKAAAGCVFQWGATRSTAGAEGAVAAGAGRVRAQRSSSTSTTGRVWRLKVLPLPSLMGITVAR